MKRGLKRLAKRMLPPGIGRQVDWHINASKFGAGYLDKKGWFDGARNGQSVGTQGEPVPWITYPAREMLERVIRPSHRIFEYGSGNSSLWWSSKVDVVAAVEHDPEWASSIAAKAPDNLTVVLRKEGEVAPAESRHIADAFLAAYPDLPTLGDTKVDTTHGMNCADFVAYALEPARYGKGYFDIFVVDGMARSLCAQVAAELIADNGIIIFDNSERWQYNPGFTELGKRGWKRLDFYGPGPVNNYEWCTYIFCRNLDWLPSTLAIPTHQRSDLD